MLNARVKRRNGCKARTFAQRPGGITQSCRKSKIIARARRSRWLRIAADDFFGDLQLGQEVGWRQAHSRQTERPLHGWRARAQLTVLILEMSGQFVDDFGFPFRRRFDPARRS